MSTTVVGGDDPSPTRASYVGLGVAAAALGAVTAIGVWLFNQAFGLVHQVVFDDLGAALAPLGAWTLVPIVALGGVAVALVMRFLRPAPLVGMPHIIDRVEADPRGLDHANAAVWVGGSVVGIGFGLPVGADTPSAMIGAHLGSIAAARLGWPMAFTRSLAVAGVAAGISSTFLAQLAAIVFALEVVLGGFGGIVFVVPTLIAVGVAGLVTYELVGTPATYPVPLGAVHWDATLAVYLAAAVLTGLAAIAYVNLLARLKPLWARVPLVPMGRMVLAAALVGLVAIWLPEVMGTGTATMKQLFGGATIPLATLIALAIAETILTPSSLGVSSVA
jgi:chloride channel protein, CIC family